MKVVVVFLFSINLVLSTPKQKWRESDDGSKFYIETENKYNWFQAWSECARKNMSLIAIDTLAKHEQIHNLLKRLNDANPPVWISGNDHGLQGHFEWASTGETFTFTNWAPGQPADGNKGEHCFLLYTDFQWHDGHCYNHKNGFICEENQVVKKSSKNIGVADLAKLVERNNNIFYFRNGI